MALKKFPGRVYQLVRMRRSKTINNGGKWELKMDLDCLSDFTTPAGSDRLLESVYGQIGLCS
jgi:hypothetical protein